MLTIPNSEKQNKETSKALLTKMAKLNYSEKNNLTASLKVNKMFAI